MLTLWGVALSICAFQSGTVHLNGVIFEGIERLFFCEINRAIIIDDDVRRVHEIELAKTKDLFAWLPAGILIFDFSLLDRDLLEHVLSLLAHSFRTYFLRYASALVLIELFLHFSHNPDPIFGRLGTSMVLVAMIFFLTLDL